jgi:hypothetical protein
LGKRPLQSPGISQNNSNKLGPSNGTSLSHGQSGVVLNKQNPNQGTSGNVNTPTNKIAQSNSHGTIGHTANNFNVTRTHPYSNGPPEPQRPNILPQHPINNMGPISNAGANAFRPPVSHGNGQMKPGGNIYNQSPSAVNGSNSSSGTSKYQQNKPNGGGHPSSQQGNQNMGNGQPQLVSRNNPIQNTNGSINGQGRFDHQQKCYETPSGPSSSPIMQMQDRPSSSRYSFDLLNCLTRLMPPLRPKLQ